MTVVSRFKCDECSCITQKRPFFNLYIPDRKNAIRPSNLLPPGAEWLCTNCKHPSKVHRFTFEKPDEIT